MDEFVRAFVGIVPSQEVAERLAEAQEELRRSSWGSGFRWTPTKNMHLTLLFLGNVERDRTPRLRSVLREAVASFAGFQVECRALGCFPSLRRPNIVWAGLKGDLDRLVRLQAQVAAVASGLADHAEDRPFRPHLTIGRAKRFDAINQPAFAGDLSRWSSVSFGGWTVDSVSLVESRLSHSGPEYRDLERFSLGTG